MTTNSTTANQRKKMKFKLIAMLAGGTLAGASVVAQPILTFESLDSHIVVGELFDINMYIEYDAFADTGLEAELTSFGYDFALDGSASAIDVGVPDSLFDAFTSINPMGGNVQGLAFPGIPDNKVLISTFSLHALTEGVGMLSISGPVDDFSGAFYVGFDPLGDIDEEVILLYEHDLVGEYSWTVEPVPEPRQTALIGMLTISMLLLWKYRRR